MKATEYFDSLPYDTRDPSHSLAIYLDQSLPFSVEAKAAMLRDQLSFSRQFVLPIVRPLARSCIILLQLLKTLVPRKFTSSRILHLSIYWGLKYFVSPDANMLILRHIHIGAEILTFLSKNVVGADVSLVPLRPKNLEAVKDHMFLNHDLNLYNFVIQLNRSLKQKGLSLQGAVPLNFEPLSGGDFGIEKMPDRWTNFLDLQTAIELYTPMYQLFLTDTDFWRASNSLQLDETIALYVSKVVGVPMQVGLVNNRHPLVPMSTLRAGFRLMLHGLAAETLHAALCELKGTAREKTSGQGAREALS